MSKNNRNKNPPQKWECRNDRERFVRIFESMFDSPAFIALPSVALRLLLLLKNEYRGNHTMNNIVCPYNDIVAHGISRNSISPSLRILDALGFIVIDHGTIMREASVYHFSDKWKDIKDVKTAKKIIKDVREQINWEKQNRKEVAHTYGDE